MDKIKNSVHLTGFAGTDPIIITFANNKRMARVSLAVNELYRNSAGTVVAQTQWFNLVFWNQKIDLIENVIKKGTGFSIEGKLSAQSYVDKKGEQRFSTEIIVNSVELTTQADQAAI